MKLTLADGAVLEYNEVFESKEKVLDYILADLKCSLANNRNGLRTLLREIAQNERLLAMFERKYGETLNRTDRTDAQQDT